MTLSELTDLVCLKCHRTDAQTQTEAKAYIAARYRMLWDSRGWRDSLGLMSMTASSQIVIMPGIVDRIQAIRCGENSNLLPADIGTVFSVDPGLFERSGEPVSFSLVSPSAVQVSPAGGKIKISSTDTSASYKVSARGLSGTTEKTETITAIGATEIESAHSYDEIWSLAKNSTTSDLTVKTAADAEILFLDAMETQKQFQRVHFHLTPDPSKTILILFKRRFKPLVNDQDATELNGIDNALIAAAVSDILEAQRQYGKAQLKMQESGALAQTMVDLERHQSASGAQIVPWDAAMSSDGSSYFDIP